VHEVFNDQQAAPQEKRFLMLALFSLSTMVNAAGWICFAPIFDLCETLYGIELFSINYMSMIYMVMFLPMYWPVVLVTDKYGLRTGLLLGICGTAFGCILRVLINYAFYWAMIGQFFMASAQIFIYNSPAKLTTNWFPENERSMATMVGTSSNIFGVLLGFAFPAIFISNYNVSNVYTEKQLDGYRNQVRNMQLCVAAMASLFALLCIFFFEEKPKQRPKS
jgi:MFS family permease